MPKNIERTTCADCRFIKAELADYVATFWCHEGRLDATTAESWNVSTEFARAEKCPKFARR